MTNRPNDDRPTGLMFSYYLHLSDHGIFTPVVPKGGFHRPSKKTTFPQEFCNEICTTYVCTIRKS